MKRDISKIFFYLTLIIFIFFFSFSSGLYCGGSKNVIYKAIKTIKHNIANSFKILTEEATTMTKIRPLHFLQKVNYNGEGVTVNTQPNQDELIFLTGFFQGGNQLRLIKKNGQVVNRWPVNFYDIFPDPKHIIKKPASNWNIDIHGALILPDGSVIFNFERCGLVKLDRCGNLVWKLDRETHHSVEPTEDGGFWVPGRRYHTVGNGSPFPPFCLPYMEDTIIKISSDGKIKKEISVPELFYRNDLEALLTATGHWFTQKMTWDGEIVHLNKIAELSSSIADDFPLFQAGDLVLSIRELNIIMVIDPENQRIKWWRIGPWIRQHDPEFKAAKNSNSNGTIVVFNNNLYRDTLPDENNNFNRPIVPTRMSNIIEIDPSTDCYKIVYGNIEAQRMLTTIRGKIELTPHGGFLITEFEGGRVFETDNSGQIVWEYINRYDSKTVAEITEARIYPEEYFNVTDWTNCSKGGSQ